jgi:hypothetical protein
MIVLAAAGGAAWAENIVFPKDAGIVNVKETYGAKGDGVTDDTAAIQKAVDEQRGRNQTLYFPNGTYLVSDSVGIFQGTAHSRDRFLTYQGQSERGTVIRLRDKAPGFGDRDKPKIVLSMYDGKSTGDTMHGYARNFTVDVGSGNPGAVGFRFMSNNTGGMERVTIRSSDPGGAGAIGLDMRQSQNGPALIKHVTVEGFDTGVQTGNTFAMVYEHITLRNQRVLGFDNFNARTTIRDLRSDNRVPALRNLRHGKLFLIEAELTGGADDAAAIILETERPRTYLRDIRVRGYGTSVRKDDRQVSGDIEEWHDGKGYSLFGAEPRSLRLPIRETPEVPWEEDLSKWVKVDNSAGKDVTEVLQQTIDQAAAQGKTTLYFPLSEGGKGAKYGISGPIRVHGSINRIIGLSRIVDVSDPSGKFKEGAAVFTFEDLKSDAIIVERFFLLGGWDVPTYVTMFENRSGKTVILKNLNQRGLTKKADPGGTWFLEDYSPSRQSTLLVAEGERIWARQFNPETPKADMVHVDGGQFWCLGMKTEGRATHVIVENGGKAEVLGGVSYQSWKNQPVDPPLFIVRNADASFSIGLYNSHGHGVPFTTIVEETRGDHTGALKRTELADYFLPLYRAGAEGEQ